MGIDAGHERLFDHCVKYKYGKDNLVGTWNCKLADSLLEMDFEKILIERPLQITITNSESKQEQCLKLEQDGMIILTSISLTRLLMPKKSSKRSCHP